MSEEKVWVEKMPENCGDCEFCENSEYYQCLYCSRLDTKLKYINREKDCPLHSIKTHDREKDKRIKELEQKVQELQEVDNKRAFRLYSVLYDVLEKQDPENVASRIEFMTSENYADICEMYKTAKNLKQHDRELVKKVCEKIEDWCNRNFNWVGNGTGYDGQDYNEMIGSNNTINKLRGFLSQIQKEFEIR